MKAKTTLAMLMAALWAASMPAPAHADGKEGSKQRMVHIGGEVYDSFTKARVSATVTLLAEDSTALDTAACDIWKTYASFSFKVPRRPARYIFKVEAEGYQTAFASYHLLPRGRKQSYEAPNILMKRSQGDVYKDVALGEVVVSGTRVQLAYRGDTLVYDASAFNLPEGSMLDALIRQMPGAVLKDDGTVYVNGRKVDYLLLNGKEFFKGKNKVMLENLPYFTVKEVKVYDKSTERSEMLGRDVEPKDYVMDVSLKREYARSYIANAEAGLGTEGRWAARAFGLYFDDHTRVAIFGNANNVNENRKPGSEGDWSPAKMERGLLSTKQAGISVQTETAERRVLNDFDATATWSDADNERSSATETFASAGSIAGGSSAASRAKDFSTTVGNNLRLRSINLMSRNFVQYSNSRSTSWGSDSTLRDTLMNSAWSMGQGRSRWVAVNGRTSWMPTLPWGDFINLAATYSWQRRQPDEQFGLSRSQYASGKPADLRNYYTDADDESYDYALTLGYTMELPRGWYVEPKAGYGQHRQAASTSRYRLERLGERWAGATGFLPSTRDSLQAAFDWDNSDWSNTLTRTYSASLTLQKATENMEFFLALPLDFCRERLHFNDYGVDTVATRTYRQFSPWLDFSYHKGGRRHSLSYRMQTTQPDFASLMPGDDTTNPLARSVSNPGLKATTEHTASWQSTFRCDSARLTWHVGADATVVSNAVGRRATYNSATGAYTFMDDNVQGNWDLNIKTGLNGALGAKRRLRYVADANAKYTHSVDFDVAYDGETDALSTVKTLRAALSLRLAYTLGKLTAGIGGKLDSRHSRSSREGFEPINVFDYQYGASLQYTIPAVNLNLSTDIKMFSRRGYGSPQMNTDDLAWNAQLSRSFLKGRLTAKVTAYDILRQISAKAYSINAQGRTETRYNCIPRYVMFSLAYRFTQKAKGKK